MYFLIDINILFNNNEFIKQIYESIINEKIEKEIKNEYYTDFLNKYNKVEYYNLYERLQIDKKNEIIENENKDIFDYIIKNNINFSIVSNKNNYILFEELIIKSLVEKYELYNNFDKIVYNIPNLNNFEYIYLSKENNSYELSFNKFEKDKIEEKIKKINKEYKYHKRYLSMCKEWSELSTSKRKKVGALIVKNEQIIADGYNGTPKGFSNECEDLTGNTNWYTLHGEANAIMKVAKSTQSSENSTLYCTLSPCKECSKLIVQSGIKKVMYIEDYRDNSGISFLKKCNIEVKKIHLY